MNASLAPLACRVGSSADGPAPYIELTIARKKFAALLDTGASASLFGDEVLAHLQENKVHLRACGTTFRLASGTAQSSGAARLVVRWERRVRRQRLIHLPGLTVPIILGRDFLTKTGIVLDIANGGYRERATGALKAFVRPPADSEAPRPAKMTQAGDEHDRPLSRKEPPATAAARTMGAAAAETGQAVQRTDAGETCAAASQEGTHPLLSAATSLTKREQARLSSLLYEYDAMFTDRPGCTKLVKHRIDTGDGCAALEM